MPLLLVVVISGLSVRHVRVETTPRLCALATALPGPLTIMGSSLLASPATAARTMASGTEAHVHGVLASMVHADGAFVPAATLSVPERSTLLGRAAAAGLATAAVLADPSLQRLVGADRAGWQWPFGRRLPDGCAGTVAPDALVLEQALQSLASNPVLLWVQFDGARQAATRHGPDSAEAVHAYRATDLAVAHLVAQYQAV